jgi:hypothetical protein
MVVKRSITWVQEEANANHNVTLSCQSSDSEVRQLLQDHFKVDAIHKRTKHCSGANPIKLFYATDSQFTKKIKNMRPGANVTKLFIRVIYNHFMVFNTIIMFYNTG